MPLQPVDAGTTLSRVEAHPVLDPSKNESPEAGGHGSYRVWSAQASIAGNEIAVECNEPSFFDGFFIAFGGSSPIEAPGKREAFLFATIQIPDGGTDYGCLTISRSGRPHPIDDVFFGLTFEDCPYESQKTTDGWTAVCMRGETSARFKFRGTECLFSIRPDWRVDVITLLYRGALRLCGDLIFFHASALSIEGRGVLLFGRSKSGKSTTALALAARGHSLIADSCASYKPSTGELMPFGRPVGIREGPKAKAVAESLPGTPYRAMPADDSVRVDVRSLLPNAGHSREPVPVHSIFFLKGFAERTDLRMANSRAELANLQPIYSSFVDAPHTRRAFELIQLLSRARLYELRPGQPDDAARQIEEVVTS